MGRNTALLADLTAAPETGWQARARCQEVDSECFFAPNRTEPKPERLAREARAKAVCATCPVREPCLAWALAVREPHGVWGGHSESERRLLLKGGPASA
ncbi:MAG: WhiB family transcriptional regulator [Egibacteraceae bacterium]